MSTVGRRFEAARALLSWPSWEAGGVRCGFQIELAGTDNSVTKACKLAKVGSPGVGSNFGTRWSPALHHSFSPSTAFPTRLPKAGFLCPQDLNADRPPIPGGKCTVSLHNALHTTYQVIMQGPGGRSIAQIKLDDVGAGFVRQAPHRARWPYRPRVPRQRLQAPVKRGSTIAVGCHPPPGVEGVCFPRRGRGSGSPSRPGGTHECRGGL